MFAYSLGNDFWTLSGTLSFKLHVCLTVTFSSKKCRCRSSQELRLEGSLQRFQNAAIRNHFFLMRPYWWNVFLLELCISFVSFLRLLRSDCSWLTLLKTTCTRLIRRKREWSIFPRSTHYSRFVYFFLVCCYIVFCLCFSKSYNIKVFYP